MPALIVLRGNSGAGKTSVAHAVRAAYGRGLAIVSQDVIRRQILREHDVPGGVNIGLIDTITRHALGAGYHVILEGILAAERYGPMLQELRRDHPRSAWYYLDVSWPETLRRHAGRPQRADFGAEQMRDWYRPLDLLPDRCETVIAETSTLEVTVRQIMREASLTPSYATPPDDGPAESRE
ncbi:kinase [Actinoallomurus rhizosphaericola]|uniref:kinase n=1 Tax=Actinoallomurus rhizosphaericola TaxID=2952536 RepID=UPI00209345C7|nr:kinase [Actinoallomurus rhizosphaericola]MCO5999811.1 kinase [Actinoallomurus rhizosphaericola]